MDFACLSRGTHSTWAHSGTSRGSGMKEIWSNMEQSHSDVARSSGKIWKDHEQIERSVEPLRRIWIAARRFCRFGRTQPSCPRRLGKYSAFCTGQGGGSFVLHPGDSWMFHGYFMDVSWCFTTSLVSWVFCRWRFQNLVGPVMSCPGPKPEWGCRWPRHRHELVLASRRTNPRKVRRLQETSGDFGFILWRKKRNEKGNIEFTWIYDELQSVTYPHRSSVAIGLLERADCFNCFKLRELRAV